LDFALPADLVAYLDELDRFIAREIKPLEDADDNIRFFDHRREWARTDFENGGLPRREWEALLRKVKDLADKAGHLRFAIPKRYGGKDGSNLWMAVIREHFAAKGLGLHNDLQNEHSIVGNLPLVTMLDRYGSDEQKTILRWSDQPGYIKTSYPYLQMTPDFDKALQAPNKSSGALSMPCDRPLEVQIVGQNARHTSLVE